MRVAAIGASWTFQGLGLALNQFENPDHVAEYLMLADRGEVERRVTKAVRFADADAVCLSGSSVPSEDGHPPDWLVKLSKGRVIVLETFDRWGNTKTPRAPGDWVQTRRGWVLEHGHAVGGPFRQHFATGSDANGEPLEALSAEILGGTRDVPALGSATGLALLCGEVNGIAGGGPAPVTGWRAAALRAWWLGAKRAVVFNPTHTWMAPQAMRDKRAWLSRKGPVLCPMNAHDAGPNWKARNRAGYIARREKRIYCEELPEDVHGDVEGYAVGCVATAEIEL